MISVLLDTGVIVALLDRRERYHRACTEALHEVSGPLVTCEPVIAEACYLLRRVKGAAQAVIQNVEGGVFQVPVPLPQCATQVLRILRKYGDREIDLADACLIHLATELRTPDILTLDSDFAVYRWGANKPFRSLIPLR